MRANQGLPLTPPVDEAKQFPSAHTATAAKHLHIHRCKPYPTLMLADQAHDGQALKDPDDDLDHDEVDDDPLQARGVAVVLVVAQHVQHLLQHLRTRPRAHKALRTLQSPQPSTCWCESLRPSHACECAASPALPAAYVRLAPQYGPSCQPGICKTLLSNAAMFTVFSWAESELRTSQPDAHPIAPPPPPIPTALPTPRPALTQAVTPAATLSRRRRPMHPLALRHIRHLAARPNARPGCLSRQPGFLAAASWRGPAQQPPSAMFCCC